MCLIRSLGALSPEQHQEENCYYHHYLEMSHWQQFSRQKYVMLKSSSSCFTSEDKASCPWLLKHPILAAPQSFLSLSLNICFGNCNIVQISARFIANCCQGGCGQTPILYLADTSAVQSTRSWGIIKVLIKLLFQRAVRFFHWIFFCRCSRRRSHV